MKIVWRYWLVWHPWTGWYLFTEDTPQHLIGEILPDLLVKGGDYKPEEIAGGKEVWANGGDVKVLNFENGCSTTNVIEKIKLLKD